MIIIISLAHYSLFIHEAISAKRTNITYLPFSLYIDSTYEECGFLLSMTNSMSLDGQACLYMGLKLGPTLTPVAEATTTIIYSIL